MKTKDQVLEYFINNKGTYLSGKELADKLNLSRTAIWKAVNKLKEEGYKIEAVTNKGYLLKENNDKISVSGIKENLINKDIDIIILDEVSSTNDYLKSLDKNSLNDETLVISNYQTKGRGRLGNYFYSPKDTGIYLSLLLKPSKWYSSQAISITTMAAVAIVDAIMEVSNIRPKIKWVNDIFLGKKKVCGILTEAEFSLESGMLEYAILGLGINIYKPNEEIPDDIKDIFGYLLNDSVGDFKNKLISSFINNFNKYYYGEVSNYIDKYRSYSFLIGSNVSILRNGKLEDVRVLGIDDECRLLVKTKDNEVKALAYGEVKVKL